MGDRFRRWRDWVRARIAAASPVLEADAVEGEIEAAPSARRHPLGHPLVLESLTSAWHLCVRGVAMSAWVHAMTAAQRPDAVQAVRKLLRDLGASVAVVSTPQRTRGSRGSLWSAVTATVWKKPGAMGVAPEHLRQLEDIAGALAVNKDAAQRAVLDLLRAVADERPLAIVIEDALAYGSTEIEGMIAALAAMRGAPVLLICLAPPSVPPVSPICMVFSGFADTPRMEDASRSRQSRRGVG